MTRPVPLTVSVGGLTRPQLAARLRAAGVRLNASAETLLDDPVFDRTDVETFGIVERTVADLGLAEGAVLSTLLGEAQERGLLCCPPVTGPYLRLATLGQGPAPDSVLSSGRAPAGAVTVGSAPLRPDDDYPKGFYLRVVGGVVWLRGYRCTDEHTWSPMDRFAFRVPAVAG